MLIGSKGLSPIWIIEFDILIQAVRTNMCNCVLQRHRPPFLKNTREKDNISQILGQPVGECMTGECPSPYRKREAIQKRFLTTSKNADDETGK